MSWTFNENDIVKQVGSDGTNKAGILHAQGKARVRFRLHAELDGDKTAERGYPAYKEAIYVSPRDIDRGREDGVDRKAKDEDFREHAEAYAAFRAWIEDPQISVRQLPYLSPAVLRLLEDGEIGTVQELASLPNLTFRDGEGRITQRVAIDSVPELVAPRALARQWLALKPAQPDRPESETERLRRELAEAQAKLATQPKRGRRPGSKNKPKAAPDAKDVQRTA